MKNILFVLILLLFGCTISVSNGDEKKMELERPYEIHWFGSYQSSFGNTSQKVGKLIMDDCIYIIVEGYHETAIAHAGNCSNPIHNSKPCK